jgi:hypothetical protein
MMQGASRKKEAMPMDGMATYELGRVLLEDRLREAEHWRRLATSKSYRKLPRVVQVVLAALT